MKSAKFSISSKVISSISVTLILIAIAVIAGVVVLIFTSGTLATMTGSTSAIQEKVAIQSVQYASGDAKITVYAQNIGPGTVIVNDLIIKNAQGNGVQTATGLTNTALVVGSLVSVGGTVTPLLTGTYTVSLTTKAGLSFTSTEFTVS